MGCHEVHGWLCRLLLAVKRAMTVITSMRMGFTRTAKTNFTSSGQDIKKRRKNVYRTSTTPKTTYMHIRMTPQ